MASTQQKVQEIIQAASAACAGIGEGPGQMPGTGSSAIASIRTTMIMAIASAHGIEITNSAAADLLHTLSETMRSDQVQVSRQAFAGWLPGIESVSSESTATGLTESIGWTANRHFEQAEAKRKLDSQ